MYTAEQRKAHENRTEALRLAQDHAHRNGPTKPSEVVSRAEAYLAFLTVN